MESKLVETGQTTRLPGVLSNLGKLTSIRDTELLEQSLLKTLGPQLGVLNIMGLHTPASAVLSAIIFNAIVIVFLIPLALRGVKYRPGNASSVLGRNLAVYGLGGVIAPFIGIWLIDLVVRLIPGF